MENQNSANFYLKFETSYNQTHSNIGFLFSAMGFSISFQKNFLTGFQIGNGIFHVSCYPEKSKTEFLNFFTSVTRVFDS